MRRPLIVVLSTLAALTHVPAGRADAQASTGYVHLKTHATGTGDVGPAPDLGVYRTWVQGVNGLTETFTQEFAPGQYTFAKVEALRGACRATALNVSFTIKAGQWTEVDVPMTYVDCAIGIIVTPVSAGGRVDYDVGTTNYASCNTGLTMVPSIVWPTFHACQGTVPYGSTIIAKLTPNGINSCCFGTSTFVANLAPTAYRRTYSFLDSSGRAPPPLEPANVAVSRIGSTYGGQVMTATFRITNNGPGNALNVIVVAAPDSATYVNNAAIPSYSIADGSCSQAAANCIIGVLPAGESTTYTVRYSGIPHTPGDTTPANFVTRSPFCKWARALSNMTTDPNESDNLVPCLDTAVPVTVTLGSASPADNTVPKGTLNVPMLQFTLTPSSQQTINSVTILSQGTGNEQVDVTSMKVYLDRNGNGLVDATDSVVSSGVFAANDGAVTLGLTPGLIISTPTNLLVTYSFNLTIAQRLGTSVVLAALGFVFVPVLRRRKGLAIGGLLLVAGITLSSCGGGGPAPTPTGPPPAAGSVTFQATLIGVTATGTTIAPVSLGGATITVTK